MKQSLLIFLCVLLSIGLIAQTPIPVTFENTTPTIGTATRGMFHLPSDSNYAILFDQNSNLLTKVSICSGVKTNITGLNATNDFALDYVKKLNQASNATVLGSFNTGGNSHLFANLNASGTIATINTMFVNTGTNSRPYKAIEFSNGNILLYLDKDPAFYNSPAIHSINNVTCGQMVELNPTTGAVIPRPDMIASIAVPPLVLPIPMITDFGYLPSGAIFGSGSFTKWGNIISQKAVKISADGTVVTGLTTLPGSNSSTANVYTNGLVKYPSTGVVYVVYTNASATSPTLVTFDEVTNVFSLIPGIPTFYINPQSSPTVKFGRIFVTGTRPTGPGTTIGAYNPITNVWYDYDEGLFTNAPAPSQTVTASAWAKNCNCAIIYGNMNQNATTLASNVSFQAKMCLIGSPLAVGMTLKLVKSTEFEITLHFTNADQYTILQKSTDGINFSDLHSIPNINEGDTKVSQTNVTSALYFRLRSLNTYSNIVYVDSKSKNKITVVGNKVIFPTDNTLDVYNSMGQKLATYKGGNAIVPYTGILFLVSTDMNQKRVTVKTVMQ